MAIRKRNYWLSTKDALELKRQEEGEEIVRFSFNDMLSALKDATGVVSPPYQSPDTGIPHNVSHPSGAPPLEPRDADFDKIRARTAANGEKDALLAVHAAYIGENPADKDSFALAHHRGSEPFKCNLKAVKSCLRALGVKIKGDEVIPSAHPEVPEHGNQIAKQHLLTHMNEFKEAADADTAKAVRAVKAAMEEDANADGYVPSNPVERGIRFEDVHQGNVPLAPIDSAFDEKGERAKADGNAQKLTAISAAFKGGDDADQRSYLFVHHDSRGRAYKDALQKAARQLNLNPIPTKSGQELSLNTTNIARSHISRHLSAFGVQ